MLDPNDLDDGTSAVTILIVTPRFVDAEVPVVRYAIAVSVKKVLPETGSYGGHGANYNNDHNDG